MRELARSPGGGAGSSRDRPAVARELARSLGGGAGIVAMIATAAPVIVDAGAGNASHGATRERRGCHTARIAMVRLYVDVREVRPRAIAGEPSARHGFARLRAPAVGQPRRRVTRASGPAVRPVPEPVLCRRLATGDRGSTPRTAPYSAALRGSAGRRVTVEPRRRLHPCSSSHGHFPMTNVGVDVGTRSGQLETMFAYSIFRAYWCCKTLRR